MRHHHILYILTITMLLLVSMPSFGQFGQPASEEKSEFKMQKRLYVGGAIGFGISSYSTSLMVAPVVGYRLSPSFDIGTRITYAYNRLEDQYTGKKYSFNDFGIGAFARYYLFFFNDLFIHAEYEAINYEYLDYNQGTAMEPGKDRTWVNGLYLGGGYRQWIGGNAFIGITVLWNLIEDINYPTNNPIFRIGVGVGI